jgi:tripartite-type tricarboxylate transporter receptor subunit TctC
MNERLPQMSNKTLFPQFTFGGATSGPMVTVTYHDFPAKNLNAFAADIKANEPMVSLAHAGVRPA